MPNPVESTTLKDRLQTALKESGKTRYGLAKYCGLTHAAVYAWFNGATNKLTYENGVKAARYLGVNTNWLACGIGPMKGDEQEPDDGQSEPVSPRCFSVPEFTVHQAADNADEIEYEEAPDSNPAWYGQDLLKKLRTSQENLRRFRIHDDSMKPLLYRADTVLCDCRNTRQIVSGKVHAFLFDGELRIRRLYRQMDGSVLVRPENPSLPNESIPAEAVSSIRVIGIAIERCGSADL